MSMPPSSLHPPPPKKHKESIRMGLIRKKAGVLHLLTVTFHFPPIKSFILETHTKEEARCSEHFLPLVLGEEKLLVYVPYRDNSVMLLFIHPCIYVTPMHL